MATKRRPAPGGALRARRPLRLGGGGQQGRASADAGDAGGQAPGQPSAPQGEGWVLDAGHPRGGGQAAAAGSASRPARGGEGPLPPAPPPPPGGREGRPASARPRSARAGHIPALPPRRRRSPGPARRLTSAGTGRFSAAAFSSSTESVCLSVSGALVSGLRSHRASFSRESRSAAGSAGSSSAASAIAAAPRPSAAAGRWGPDREARATSGRAGASSTAPAAGRAERADPETLPRRGRDCEQD